MVVALEASALRSAPPPGLTLQAVQRAPASVVLAGGGKAPASVEVVREWSGPICRARVINEGKAPVSLAEVVLCEVAHAYPAQTPFYGEGFTMLSQTVGTLGKPTDTGLT